MKQRKNKSLRPVKTVGSYFENCRAYTEFIEPGSFPVQATKATPEQVDLHIARQQALGERIIADTDQPRRIEFVAVGLIVLAAIAWAGDWGWM